jgi:hypothetical protein
MLISKAYLSLRLRLVWIRYAIFYSIRVSSVVLIVTKIGTVVFSNMDIRLFPRLAMHHARTLEYGTDLNCASVVRHGLVLMRAQVIAMLPSLSNFWLPLRRLALVILAEA